MSKYIAKIRKFIFSGLRNVVSLILLTTFLVSITTASSVTDGSTPLGLSPGTPAGAYALSGFDNINVYNGNLNFYLPFLTVGGRGTAAHTIGRMIEQHWRMDHWVLPDQVEVHTPMYNPWVPLNVGYSPGVLFGRKVNDGWCAQSAQSTSTLTRLTFVAPDGTEHELIDKLTGGQIRTSFCWAGNGFSRGTVFVSADGTSMSFVSDAIIYDNQFGGAVPIYPTGYLMLRDGTRYRIVNGRVSWMRDRNGNQLSFTYPTAQGMTVTDSLGRQITVTANVSDVQPYGLCDQITFNGLAGAPRTIRLSKTNLGSALRTGYSLQTPAALFGYGSSSTNHDPQVISAAWLPDGRSYVFRYNSYGELARVELPTGGAFEYDYAAGLTTGSNSGGVFYTTLFGKIEIYRRVTEKRVYEGGALVSKMTISRTDSQYTNDTNVTVEKRDSSGTLLSRTKHYFYGNPAKSFDIEPLGSTPWKQGREYQTESYDTNGTTVLRRVENTWQQPVAGSNWPLSQPESSDFARMNNPQVTETRTVLVDANQVSKNTFSYDQFSNRTDTYEYDFGSGGAPAYAIRRSQTTFLTTNPVNGLDYASPNPSASSIHLRSLPQHQRVYSVNPSNGQESQVSHTETLYDQTTLQPWYGSVTQWTDPGGARGNTTKVRRWVDQAANYIESRAEYDQVGNVSKAIDPLNQETLFQYSSTYSHSLPTQFTSPVPDPTGAHGSNTALVNTRVYDVSTGLVTSATDANNKVTTLEYNDPLDRLTKVNRPDGGWTSYAYSSNQYGHFINTVTLLNASGAQLSEYQYFDGLGRPSRSFLYENYDPTKPWLTTDKQYDAMGRPWRMSQTYRSSGAGSAVNPPGKWTETVYDALGRPKTVTTRPDNAVMTSTYSGNQVTVTDQAGKSRRRVTNSIGYLTQVTEDPNGLAYTTNYQYDALGNLRQVDQGGQLRLFMYDSLSRVVRVKHPEQTANSNLALTDPVTGNTQWSMAYAYDGNGNLTSRIDARNVTTTLWYDNLNRSTKVDYSDTPTYQEIRRHYDGAVNGRGRFWHDYFYRENFNRAEHAVVDSYDAVGRALNRRQHFYENTSWQWGPAYNTFYAYDLAGNVTTQIYPSGRVVNYGYDTAGRFSSFTGNLGDSMQRNYSTAVIYDETGAPRQEQFGTDTPVYNKSFYNTRGQLNEIRVSTHSVTTPGQETNWNRGALINRYSNQSWSGSGTDNNGNLLAQMIYVPNDDQISGYQMNTMNYTYDQLNRVDKVEEFIDGSTFAWRQDYNYDRWGNRTINESTTTNGIPEPQFTVDAATNRLGVPGGYSGVMQYDAAGNLTNDTYTGQGTRAFDAENRMTSAQVPGLQTSNYVYDADGRRTRRGIAGSIDVWQVYGLSGELLAEYPAYAQPTVPQKEYGYRNGQLLVTADGRTNVALSANGGVASASTAHTCCGFSVGGAINGNIRGPWGNGEGWNDATPNEVPDWFQVDFAGSKTIVEIDVFSLHDNYTEQNTPTETQTFSLYGLINFDVQYWNGNAWITIPGGNVTGNNKVWRKFTFAPITTNKIRLWITGVPDSWTRLVELQAWEAGSGVANLAVNKPATQSSTAWDAPPQRGVDGNTNGNFWNGSVTHTATETQPWWQVDLQSVMSIQNINVWNRTDCCGEALTNFYVFVSDNPFTSNNVASTQSQPGVSTYYVAGQGGVPTTVAVNRTGRYVRVQLGGYERLSVAEVEVLGSGGGAKVQWLVSDQLGTPRMVLDQTGTLASTKRHDYLPFGEELFANGRTSALGYGFADGVRQKFTGYERDSESGLDYAQARYYSSSQGRFTSVDPLGASGSTRNPQSFNRYAYVLNNPLNLVDPTGMVYDRGGGLFGALSSPWNDIPWTTAEGFTTVVACEITGVEGAENGTGTTSEAPAQDAGRILIIVGDPGLREHNVGTNFDRVAETKRQELEAQGYTVIVVRASSDQDFANALTNNGLLNGVEYIGHASYDALHVGQASGDHTNLTSGDLSMLSNANLRADAYVKLVACYAGSGGADSIAAGIARQLQRTTLAFDGGTLFSGNERRIVTETTRSGQVIAPRNGPLYLIEDRGTRMQTFPP